MCLFVNALVHTDLLCDMCHSLLQIVVLLGQSSVLLEQWLADFGSQLQISLFLLVGKQEEEEEEEEEEERDDKQRFW